MIDKELSAQATAEDNLLLKTVNPANSILLTYIAQNFALKKIPFVGTVVSDATIITEILNNRDMFAPAENTSVGFLNTVEGDYGLNNILDDYDIERLNRIVDDLYSSDRISEVHRTSILPLFAEVEQRLEQGEDIDLVPLADKIAYLYMWHLSGLPTQRLETVDFDLAVKTFRTLASKLNPTKRLSDKEYSETEAMATFFESLLSEAYKDDAHDSLPKRMKSEGFSEDDAVYIGRSLFLAGAEVAASFIPRMSALFIKSNYIDYASGNHTHIPFAVEEAMRVTAPTPVCTRVALESTEVRGIPVKKGERIVLSTVEASKRVGDFDPTAVVSDQLKGIWFGAGIHQRLGVQVALVEAELFARFLAKANKASKLRMVEQASSDKGHIAGYKELVVSAKVPDSTEE